MLRNLFGKATPRSVLLSLMDSARQEEATAKKQLILAQDNLHAAEAAIKYTAERIAALKASAAALCIDTEVKPSWPSKPPPAPPRPPV